MMKKQLFDPDDVAKAQERARNVDPDNKHPMQGDLHRLCAPGVLEYLVKYLPEASGQMDKLFELFIAIAGFNAWMIVTSLRSILGPTNMPQEDFEESIHEFCNMILAPLIESYIRDSYDNPTMIETKEVTLS